MPLPLRFGSRRLQGAWRWPAARSAELLSTWRISCQSSVSQAASGIHVRGLSADMACLPSSPTCTRSSCFRSTQPACDAEAHAQADLDAERLHSSAREHKLTSSGKRRVEPRWKRETRSAGAFNGSLFRAFLSMPRLRACVERVFARAYLHSACGEPSS